MNDKQRKAMFAKKNGDSEVFIPKVSDTKDYSSKFYHTKEKGIAEKRKKGEPYWNKPWISKGGHNSKTGFRTDKAMKSQDQALKDLDETKCKVCNVKFKNHHHTYIHHDWVNSKR